MLLMSPACLADSDPLKLFHASVVALYEGSEVLTFELHAQRRMRSSVVVAKAQLPLATVFSRIGLAGVVWPVTMPLVSDQGETLASLIATIGSSSCTLNEVACSVCRGSILQPERPGPSSMLSLDAHARALSKYRDECRTVHDRLQRAFDYAALASDCDELPGDTNCDVAQMDDFSLQAFAVFESHVYSWPAC